MRFGSYEIRERWEIEGEGFDALARDAHGADVRLWAGRPGSGSEPGPSVLDQQRRLLARTYHASLPRILGAEVIEDRGVIVTAPYRGVRLADRLRAGRLPAAAALDVVRSVGAALAKAHAREVAHGAVGPSEILLGDDDRPLLLHLGLAPFLGPRAARAPAGDPAVAADVFGLARVLAECLGGEDPFAAGTFRDPARPAPDELAPDLPEGLRRLLARALGADLRTRVARADELAGDLAVIRASWDEPAGPAPRATRSRAALAVVAVGLAAGIGLWAARGCFEAVLR